MIVEIKKLDDRAIIPEYKTIGSAGMDLHIILDKDQEIIKKNEIKMFKTGLAIALQDGYEGQIRSRSGLSLKNGLIVLNAPGTIDSDYRGEICLIMMNCGDKDYIINQHDRLAQLIITKYEKIEFTEVEILNETLRGDNRFGSTGVK